MNYIHGMDTIYTKKYQCRTYLFITVYGPIAVAVWIQSNTYILPIIIWIKSRIRHVYCLALVIPFLYQSIYLDLSNEANANCHLIISSNPNKLNQKFQATWNIWNQPLLRAVHRNEVDSNEHTRYRQMCSSGSLKSLDRKLYCLHLDGSGLMFHLCRAPLC